MIGRNVIDEGTKILRIGILQDGRIVHERLIKPGQHVTIGASPRNTFVLAAKNIPKKFMLFQAKGNGYVLKITEGMEGKVAAKDGILGLDQVRKAKDVARKGDTWSFPLEERSRGKVVLDNFTVLFQFVPAPPESARMVNQHDFRPQLLDEDDPVFLGSMALFLSMAAVLMIYVWNTEPLELVSLDEAPDRFVELVLPRDDTPPPEELVIESDDGETVVKEDAPPEETTKKVERKPQSEQEKKAAEAARLQKKRDDMIARSKLLTALIGTRGESSRDGSIEDIFGRSDGAIDNLQNALENVGGTEIASSGALGVKTGGSGGREDASIGDLAKGGGGAAKVDSGPATQVKGKAVLGGIDAGGGEHSDGIKSVVRRKKGQVQYCYESRLKENPNIGGRLAINVNIAGGRVTSVTIEENSTGDSGIEGCVVGKVRRWRFAPEVTERIYLPFALSSN
jgi:hypothetical protein